MTTTVAELLADESRWCQDAEAKDENGIPCAEWSEVAASWCIEGACIAVYGLVKADEQIRKVGSVIGHCVYRWNDTPGRTHAEVLAAVRKAGI